MDRKTAIMKRTEWFREARLGMFIHWGLYAIPARGEWVRHMESMTDEDYQPYFDEFDPSDYDPRSWARTAKTTGMKYAVLTAKHHDGFCLFDSQLTDFKSTRTPAGRDFVREFVDAFREEGIRVGFYYSLIDWHHPDYPVQGDRTHPMRNKEQAQGEPARDFNRYIDYMHGQVRELCANYGSLDILWFDFSYDEMRGEKWRAAELVTMVRELQPDIIIDNRLEGGGEGYGSIATEHPSIYAGDFASPEQVIPPEGVTDEAGNAIPWEACITLNNNWGYHATDHAFKSPKLIIRKLVECVSKNGNLLLNIGPDSNGAIPEPSLRLLNRIGEWMRRNERSIRRCGKSQYPKPEWGYWTQNGNRLYAHIFDGNVGPLPLPHIKDRVVKARLLADGSEVKLIDAWNIKEYTDYAFINFGTPEHFTFPLPDDIDTVVEFELREL